MEGCIFCAIVSGAAEAAIVYRDDLLAAFMDMRPMNPGHTLVVPVAHAARLAEVPEQTAAQLFVVAQRVAAAIRASGIRCDGINLVLADGRAAAQEVQHVHLHVIPRFFGDGIAIRALTRPVGRPQRSELEDTAERIRAELERPKSPPIKD